MPQQAFIHKKDKNADLDMSSRKIPRFINEEEKESSPSSYKEMKLDKMNAF